VVRLRREVRLFDEAELRNMSPEERLQLLHTLVEIDNPGPFDRLAPRPPRSKRRRAIVLAVIITCCVILAAWTGVLAATLPPSYRAGGWNHAWVGFDIGLLAAMAATGWAAWRGRQVLIMCLVVVATLLLCDAWFDVMLDVRTRGFDLSLLTAVVVELPLAALAILAARRLLRLTIAKIAAQHGQRDRVPSLWRAPLFSDTSEATVRDLFPHLTYDLRHRPGDRTAPGPCGD
jgi:hypothetical protein